MCSLYITILNKKEKMGLFTILSVIHIVTICTMLNFKGGNKKIQTKKPLRVNFCPFCVSFDRETDTQIAKQTGMQKKKRLNE